jgi:hypothetical protein
MKINVFIPLIFQGGVRGGLVRNELNANNIFNIFKCKNNFMSVQTLTKTKQVIKIGEQPMVIMPLTKWQEMKDKLEDLKDTQRFTEAFIETRGQKTITLKELQKKYKL